MPSYIRARVPGGTYFFTVTLHDRRQALLTDHIQSLKSAFRNARRRRPFTVDAIVILPDHLHCIWTLPPDDGDCPARWHDIKSRFAAAIPRGEPVSHGRARRGERGIWQRRYWEHLVRDEADFARHVDYIHFNPVKHGWARRASDWPYSSFHRFASRGLYETDWGGSPEPRDP